MRNLALMIGILIYLLLSIGLKVNYHFCGGELSEISFLLANKGRCACGTNDDNSEESCCKNTSTFYQIDQKQIPVNSSFFVGKKTNLIQFQLIDFQEYNFVFSFTNHKIFSDFYFRFFPPPKILYLLNCIWRL